MNREERRSYMKQGASKETVDRLQQFQSPCTLAEAVQISRATSEDVLEDYHRRVAPVQMAQSIQIEVLKSMLFESGLISEERFRELYIAQAEKVNGMIGKHNEDEVAETHPNVSAKVDTIEVKIEKE